MDCKHVLYFIVLLEKYVKMIWNYQIQQLSNYEINQLSVFVASITSPLYAMQYRIKQLQEIIINTFTCIMQSWLIDSAIFEK